MHELSLILTDFSPPASSSPESPPPRLAALELLRARAQRQQSADWRARVAAALLPAVASLPPAAWVAAAWPQTPIAPDDTAWLATPVHYFAGLDSVHLHPSGLLQLTPSECTRLTADFAAVFADSPWRLQPCAGRELLLTGPAASASGPDPVRLLGAELHAGLPGGEGAATLRRLGTEIEMWLHGHALNAERSARGALPVTGLWPWGGAVAQQIEAARAAPRTQSPPAVTNLYGEDTAVLALMHLAAAADRIEPLPACYDVRVETRQRNVVLYPMLGEQGLAQAFGDFEQRWLVPALIALREHRLSRLELVGGEQAYRLGRLQLARFWRARVPWWQPWH